MKGIPQRRHNADKKSKKRWDVFPKLDYLGFPLNRTDCIGRYRKSKGCECHTCTERKKIDKKNSNEKRRTENKKIKKGLDID